MGFMERFQSIAIGYKLYGPPAATFNGQTLIVAQAVVWPSIQSAVAGENT